MDEVNRLRSLHARQYNDWMARSRNDALARIEEARRSRDNYRIGQIEYAHHQTVKNLTRNYIKATERLDKMVEEVPGSSREGAIEVESSEEEVQAPPPPPPAEPEPELPRAHPQKSIMKREERLSEDVERAVRGHLRNFDDLTSETTELLGDVALYFKNLRWDVHGARLAAKRGSKLSQSRFMFSDEHEAIVDAVKELKRVGRVLRNKGRGLAIDDREEAAINRIRDNFRVILDRNE